MSSSQKELRKPEIPVRGRTGTHKTETGQPTHTIWLKCQADNKYTYTHTKT